MSRIILHIGTEKTGSTAVQQYLGGARDQLLTHGVLYPRAPANQYHNHIGLAAYAADDNLIDDVRRSLGISDQLSLGSYRQSLEQELTSEVKKHQRDLQTIVFSNEHCHSRLVSEAEVARIAEILTPLSNEISVVVYLRRQDLMAVSLYSTYLKSGGTRLDIFPERIDFRYYNFARLLDTWARVFGEESIRPRIYDRSELTQGNVVKDLMSLMNLDASSDAPTIPRSNESFSPIAQEMVRHLNKRAAENASIAQGRDVGALINRLTSTFAGSGRRPARNDALAFYGHFREQNEQVRSRWFPDREQLFEEDFSMYPESDDVESLTLADAADLLIAFSETSS